MGTEIRRRTFPGAGLVAAVTVAVAVLTPSAAAADAASDRAEQVRYAVETVSLRNDRFLQRKADFLAAGCATLSGCRKPSPYHAFDWSTDGCSGTPAALRSLFDPACQEHDFGYRNFGKGLTLGRNEQTRRWIDDRFRAEMKGICNYKYSDWTQYANLQACFAEADGMYAAVRVLSDWSERR
jgi:hypothetical protein